MPLIKLDAIDSTNEYLKQLNRNSELKNYTAVMANEQTKGRGQMGSTWVSEKGKNLTMSILVKDLQLHADSIFTLNIVAALAVVNIFKKNKIPNVCIKWPNDIMAGNKKVAGILIENAIKPEGYLTSVIGIGINLNQTNFELLPQATSLKCITGLDYHAEDMAVSLVECLKEMMPEIQNPESLWIEYHRHLYKLNYPAAFEDRTGNQFMGIIKKVTSEGKLEVLLEDDSLTYYELKEIKMLY